ncbi:lipid-A-disaccharide synthase [Aliidiomarina iranensis]|uniref:Lipid-A-disaccharide synthase n=1 Tax=Aliidiomarina iranensis TaxID=1434071 RepID=A0A432W0L7_9GAMM|nr:lipid-A-disaccharide synthase [Aliidiomarina iranensis]RUO22532.1 lipid-A-disaccharide synthase [Aliidiomarina iranensis]
MAQEKLCIGIVAGEASGDILGASLMEGILQQYPHAEFIGVGGSRMQAQGLTSLFPMETLSVMGFIDVLKQLPTLLRARRNVVNTMLAAKPDVFVGIDAPDFNLPIEKKLKHQGIPTVHYVSPSVWAWRPKRIFAIAKATNMVLGILPFEAEFYAKYQVPFTYVGHPLADQFPENSAKEAAREQLKLANDKRYVGLLPGSRGSEVGLLAEHFIAAAGILQAQDPELNFLVPLVNEQRKKQFLTALNASGLKLNLHIFSGQSHEVIAASDATILASGTVALEAMLIKRPMVVCYRFGWLNYQIAKRFVQVNHFSLPNLLHAGLFNDAKNSTGNTQAPAAQRLVKELLQDEVTGEAIAAAIQPLLAADNTALNERFNELHQLLKQNAGLLSANAVIAVAKGNN